MSAVLTTPLYREPVEFRAVEAPITRIDIVRAWCAQCGMPSPSKADVAALLALLVPSMTVAELLGETAS
ncbi:hypothetical protein J2W30_003642 [Variovorax boronicumulans]|uniref:hypothetical protein n=1 Tax=Variovorax boronicumulans TaxID=436515 RepID=UPI00278A3D4C|nr:hypothetical protein [Variovorax boronicumulans]MDQ0035874.1 hypothetical protein [Variovorax boronicumulans]